MVSAHDVTVQHFYIVHLFLEFDKCSLVLHKMLHFLKICLQYNHILSINFNNKDVFSYKLMYIHRLLTEKYRGLRY